MKKIKIIAFIIILLLVVGTIMYGYPEISFYYNLNKAAYYSKGHQYSESLEVYEKLIKLKPELYELYFNKAVILAKLGQTPEALATLKKATQLNDKDPELYYNLSVLYESIDQEKSKQYMEKAKSLGFGKE